MYTLNLGVWNSVFAVPCEIADRHLKFATGAQLKVLLWVLRNSGRPFGTEEISRQTGESEESICQALLYWCNAGVLAEQQTALGASLSPAAQKENDAFVPNISLPLSQPAEPKEPEKSAPTVSLPPHRLEKPDSLYVAERIEHSEAMAALMQEAQMLSGSTISAAMSSLLVYLCDDCGLPEEVLAMLLRYAKNIDRFNTRYIETVGEDWAKNGVLSLEEAEKKLAELDENTRAWKRIETVLGISHRKPSKAELTYAQHWIVEWKMNDGLLTEAYEQCVDNTGKFSMKYMHKVLERWHTAGVSTAEQAKLAQQMRKNSQKQEQQTSFDIDAFERASRANLEKGIIA